MTLPTTLTFGEVAARFGTIEKDISSDSNRDPEKILENGTVTLTPRATRIVINEPTFGPTTYYPKKQTFTIVSGFLKDADGTNSTKQVASDVDPDHVFSYHVQVHIDDPEVADESYDIVILAGDTVNLGTAQRVNPLTVDSVPDDLWWARLTALEAAGGVPGAQGPPGVNGQEVQLQNSGGFIQWRLGTTGTWTNLVALSALTGATGAAGANGTDAQEISLQNTGTALQWRRGTGTWSNLILVADLIGPAGPQGPTGATGPAGADGPPGTSAVITGTSTTSLTVGLGSRTLTTQTGLALITTSLVRVANGTNYMTGNVTAYSTSTGVMTVNVTESGGSGTLASWTITLTGSRGAVGPVATIVISGTSTSSVTVGSGSKTLTTQGGIAYTVGSYVRVFRTSNSGVWMSGLVTAYNTTTGVLTLTVDQFVGSGTFTDWTNVLSTQVDMTNIYNAIGVIRIRYNGSAWQNRTTELAARGVDASRYTGMVEWFSINYPSIAGPGTALVDFDAWWKEKDPV